MKLGITQIVLGDMSLDQTLTLCDAAGYDAVKLTFDKRKDLRVDMSDGELADVSGRCRSAGVEVTSVIASFAERGNLLSSDAAAMV